MLYALIRADGNVSIAWMMPKEITKDGKTLPVTITDAVNKTLHAIDEGVAVTFPLPSDDVRTYEADSVPGATLVFYDIQDTINNSPDTITSYEKISVNDLPATRSYRNAWERSGTTISHNMPKARDIHRDKLREARKPMLEVLDIAYQRADEQDDGPEKRRIAAEKQKLRDVTANKLIERAKDIAALEKLTLEYLLAHP
jgi:hypothetical protein